MASNVPDAEQAWASGTGSQAHGDTRHAEPVATASETDVNEEKAAVYEVAEESESHASVDLEKADVKPAIERTRSNWTTTTGTSFATEPDDAQTDAPRKRTWGQRLNPLKRRHPPAIPDERQVSKEYKAGIFSRLTFQWIAALMDVGYQRPLETNDIWAVNPDRSVNALKAKMNQAFSNRKAKRSKDALVYALYDTFKTEFLVGGACQLVAGTLQVLSPFTLKYLIAFSEDAYLAALGNGPTPSIGKGLGLVFGITCMQVLQTTCTNHFIYRGMVVGGQARSVLISMLFEKSGKMSGRAKAGGKAPDAGPLPKNVKPGSDEEKAHFEKKLGKGESATSGNSQGWSNGRIVNLMSVDTYRIDQASGMFHVAWVAPIQALLTLALLCINLTYSALAGFAFIIVMMPLLSRAINSMMRRRRFINKITDQRVSLTQEIVSSVRFVKFFGWEQSFLNRVAAIRTREIKKIAFLLSIRNLIMAVSMSVPIFASMLAFITYRLTHPSLNPAPTFSSLALFNSLRFPLNLLPMVIGQIVDARASLGRIQDFLEAEEIQDDAGWDPDGPNAITLEAGDFTWERVQHSSQDIPGQDPKGSKQLKQEKKQAQAKAKETEKQMQHTESEKPSSEIAGPSVPANASTDQEEETPFKIQNINLSIRRDELVAVIGSVGSGKSSLLAALAGDMRMTGGHMTLGASKAFCPQYAWIQNATVRENIVFGNEYNKKWYNEVVDACALRPDLEMLPVGDMTEIGERGITVSGGQKQRLNIARAIYFNADIVLMDDPLSAVDAHVGRHIMNEAICGLLKGKARVLATHQLHVLHRADRIVWMKDGGIHKVSTFNELMADDKEFQKLMETTAAEEKEEDQKNADEDEEEGEKKASRRRKGRKSAAALMQQEERAVSSVSADVYLDYIRAAGSILVAPLIFLMLVISQGSNIVTSLWLSYWTANRFHYAQGTYIGVYSALGVSQAMLQFTFSASLSYFGTKSSRVMLHRAIARVLRAPMSFFDTTPMGRITNRFSKDVDTMDNSLTDSLRMFFMSMCSIIAVFILIIAYYYYFVVALAPLTILFLFATSYYRASARELKRHEAVLRSVVFSRFSEGVNGISTIRAYGMEKQFLNRLDESIDSMGGAYYLTFANQRWLSCRLDVIGNLLVLTMGILVVTARFSINPSVGGLVLSYILSTVQFLQFAVRQMAEVENNMNATERIHYYGTQLEEEAPAHLGDVRPSWPEKGEIVFDNVEMRYRPGLPLVLKGLSLHVRPGERIGVVGRTGAGKSTIMSTLFRLTEVSSGSITIDGVDISTIGLQDLRSRLSIIPQDPTLFRGTIRSNLDPFDEHTDLQLWHALRQADLVGDSSSSSSSGEQASPQQQLQAPGSDAAPAAAARSLNLDTPVDDEGLNFSLGQRQMLALARALVRGSRIIVCDEATSSVDFETDQKIQRTIVRGFRGCTLLCIAHRLKTIIGYDRILVMDAGAVAELDAPLALFDRPGGIFRSMCERSGIRREDFFESEEARFAAENDGA